jgi:transcriptional regulator with XRE-family HTH domain
MTPREEPRDGRTDEPIFFQRDVPPMLADRKRTAFRAARRSRGLRQTDVSRLTGISQSVISALEIGDYTNPTWDTLSKLAHVYACRPEQLIPHVRLPASATVTEPADRKGECDDRDRSETIPQMPRGDTHPA